MNRICKNLALSLFIAYASTSIAPIQAHAYLDEDEIVTDASQIPSLEDIPLDMDIPGLGLKKILVSEVIRRALDRTLPLQQRKIYFESLMGTSGENQIILALLERRDLAFGGDLVEAALYASPPISTKLINSYLDQLTAGQLISLVDHLSLSTRNYEDNFAVPLKAVYTPYLDATQRVMRNAIAFAKLKKDDPKQWRDWGRAVRYAAQIIGAEPHNSDKSLLREAVSFYPMPEVWLALARLNALDASTQQLAEKTFGNNEEKYGIRMAAAIAAAQNSRDARAFVIREMSALAANSSGKESDFKEKFAIFPALVYLKGDDARPIMLRAIGSQNLPVARMGLSMLWHRYPDAFFSKDRYQKLPKALRTDYLIAALHTYQIAPKQRPQILKAVTLSQINWMRQNIGIRDVIYLEQVRGNLISFK